MTALFGSAARTALTEPRQRINADHITAAAAAFTHLSPRVHVSVDRDADTLLVHDGDLVTSTTLTDLTARMTRARIRATAVPHALAAWVEHRPVTPADAAHSGHLILDWADPTQHRLAWTLVVARLYGILAPFQYPLLPAAERARIRDAAREHSARLPVATGQLGAITLMGAEHPGLSTAALINPETARARLSPGRTDTLVVITPGVPVACGSPAAVARMSEETNEAHAIVSWDDLARLRP